MSYFYSASTGLFYNDAIHADLPEDCRPVTPRTYKQLVTERPADKDVIANELGDPVLVDREAPAIDPDSLCQTIDLVADSVRRDKAGDPLLLAEYERTAAVARTFRDNGYPKDDIARSILAWVTESRDARQAADDIIAKAEAHDESLLRIREIRLQAKEQVRKLVAEGELQRAQEGAREATEALLAL